MELQIHLQISSGGRLHKQPDQLGRVTSSQAFSIRAAALYTTLRATIRPTLSFGLRSEQRELIDQMGRGAAVAIVPYHKELTTQEAANILNVSRQYLVRLPDRDEIAHHKVNRHRRISFGDLLEYKRLRDERRREGLRKLTQMSQEVGMY